MLAILEDAIGIFAKTLCGGAVKPNDARAVRIWFESRDRSLPFTFECICDLLGFDSGYIRRGLWVVRATPNEAAARLASRHHGRSARLSMLPRAAPGVVSLVAAADVALAARASVTPPG